MEDEDERQDLNELESVVQRTTDQESSTLYCAYPVRTFLCMSVHHNNKQHNGGLQLFCLKHRYGSLLRLRLCRSLTDQSERRFFAVKPSKVWGMEQYRFIQLGP
jgi:hypothetical protein